MVEGAKLNWVTYVNEPIGMISNSIADYDVLKPPWEFTKKDNNTIFLSTLEHGTKGFRVDGDIDLGYANLVLDKFIDLLEKVTYSEK